MLIALNNHQMQKKKKDAYASPYSRNLLFKFTLQECGAFEMIFFSSHNVIHVYIVNTYTYIYCYNNT